MILARESMWMASIAFGCVDFLFELYSPESNFKGIGWRMPWSGEGKIKLDEDDEEVDAVDSLDGGGVVRPRNADGDLESPVLTANIYER